MPTPKPSSGGGRNGSSRASAVFFIGDIFPTLCIVLAAGVIRSGHTAHTELGAIDAVPGEQTGAQCTFCGKDRGQVDRMAIMPEVMVERTSASPAICSECLALCSEIIIEELGDAPLS
jgi:ABC-type arginine transport system permease subunit